MSEKIKLFTPKKTLTVAKDNIQDTVLKILTSEKERNFIYIPAGDIVSRWANEPKKEFIKKTNECMEVITTMAYTSEKTISNIFTKVVYDADKDVFIGYLNPELPRIDYTQLCSKRPFELKETGSIRLYELMSEYKSLGMRTFTNEELVEGMAFSGNKSLESVIKACAKEINEVSDIKVDYIKDGTGENTKYAFMITTGEKKEEKDVNAICREIIDYLNEVAGKHFRVTDANKRHINARLEENFTVEDFKTVIDTKVSEWGEDEKMAKYIRPETLFGTKFEGYLNQGHVGEMAPDDPDYIAYMEYFARGADY